MEKDENNKLIEGRNDAFREILNEMQLFETRRDLTDFKAKWEALKERIEDVVIGDLL